MVGWAVVVFQKCIPGPVTLYAGFRPSKKTIAERVEMCMAMVEERNPENSLLLVQGGKQVLSSDYKIFIIPIVMKSRNTACMEEAQFKKNPKYLVHSSPTFSYTPFLDLLSPQRPNHSSQTNPGNQPHNNPLHSHTTHSHYNNLPSHSQYKSYPNHNSHQH